MQKVILHPMGLSQIAIVCHLRPAETIAASYRWDLNSFRKLGNFLHKKNTSSINSKTTVVEPEGRGVVAAVLGLEEIVQVRKGGRRKTDPRAVPGGHLLVEEVQSLHRSEDEGYVGGHLFDVALPGPDAGVADEAVD